MSYKITQFNINGEEASFINQVSGNITYNNKADNEDLKNINNVIKFADKEYSTSNFSGLGRTYLRKNITNNKNILTQDMMTASNTIYIIQYDYDLNSATITVPENSVLDFQGGSLKNGTINCNNTSIKAEPVNILEGCGVGGTLNIEYTYAEWFGAKADGVTDCYGAITQALYVGPMNCHLLKGTYAVSDTIVMTYRRKLLGLQADTTLIVPTSGATMDSLILCGNTGDNTTAYGHLKDLGVLGAPNHGIKCYGTTLGFYIENVQAKYCGGAGIAVMKSWYASYRNINCWANKYGLLLNDADNISGDTAVNCICFENCWFNTNTDYSVYINGSNHGLSFKSCTFEKAGICEMNIENFYFDLSLYSNYFETNVGWLNVKSKYAGMFGKITCIGNFFQSNGTNDTLINIDHTNCIASLALINNSFTLSTNTYNILYLFNVGSANCFIVGSLPYNKLTFNPEAEIIRFGSASTFNDYYMDYKNNHTRYFKANQIGSQVYGYEATPQISIGLLNMTHVNDKKGGPYLLYTRLNRTTGNFETILNYNYDDGSHEMNLLTIGPYGKMYFGYPYVYGKFVCNNGPSENRPLLHNDGIGVMYLDTTIGKPIWMIKMNGTLKWIDATGASV